MTGRRVSRYLLARIPAVVAAAPGGGLSRGELAAACRVREFERVFALSLLACYQRGEVDFCAGYVVTPPEDEPS